MFTSGKNYLTCRIFLPGALFLYFTTCQRAAVKTWPIAILVSEMALVRLISFYVFIKSGMKVKRGYFI
ncbi:hypothetical protein DMA11_12880 [Marinilabiliaceae bacterium JC017]|nr:hypothetical protein DMA11_12880 [Marinilabiliaceae bacterium JC017]